MHHCTNPVLNVLQFHSMPVPTWVEATLHSCSLNVWNVKPITFPVCRIPSSCRNAPVIISTMSIVESGLFQTALIFWLLGLFCNVLAVAFYLGFSATQTLRRSFRDNSALAALTFTLSAIHPEAMCIVADRRQDAFMFRILGCVPVIVSRCACLCGWEAWERPMCSRAVCVTRA